MSRKPSPLLMRLLKRNISPLQLAGYALANLVGLAIVLVATQFYRDVTAAFADDTDALMGENYIVVSKTVRGVSGLFGGSESTGFSKQDIDRLSSQPWVQRIGCFTAADFDVFAAIEMGGRRMSTSLFLESVPDEFFDVKPREWNRYEPKTGEPLPVILPREYLALYNFGYASAHGMPQLSEAMMSMVPLKLSISGNGHQETIDARIVAFSSRLNTIAVPEQFINAANAEMGSSEVKEPARLIIKVADKADPAIGKYLSDNGMEQAGDTSSAGHLSYFLRVLTAVVVAIGGVITILSFFILMLSIFLLLQKNRIKIHELMLLGYTPAQVSRGYYRLVAGINLAVTAVACGIMVGAQQLWQASLDVIDVKVTAPWLTVGIGIAVMGLLTAANLLAIRRKVRSAFRL